MQELPASSPLFSSLSLPCSPASSPGCLNNEQTPPRTTSLLRHKHSWVYSPNHSALAPTITQSSHMHPARALASRTGFLPHHTSDWGSQCARATRSSPSTVCSTLDPPVPLYSARGKGEYACWARNKTQDTVPVQRLWDSEKAFEAPVSRYSRMRVPSETVRWAWPIEVGGLARTGHTSTYFSCYDCKNESDLTDWQTGLLLNISRSALFARR